MLLLYPRIGGIQGSNVKPPTTTEMCFHYDQIAETKEIIECKMLGGELQLIQETPTQLGDLHYFNENKEIKIDDSPIQIHNL